MKAATAAEKLDYQRLIISIHAAREGGDEFITIRRGKVEISIHAAREGGDLHHPRFARASTISIHAAREGGDKYRGSIPPDGGDFNPRRP